MNMTKEYYEQYQTGKTNDRIRELNKKIQQIIQEGGEASPDYLMGIASKIADENIIRGEGGPFAALLVKYKDGLDSKGNGIGTPEIIGIGANHVVPANDPSAHGEMSCLRDATKRLEFSDLDQTVMFTSCECCPQCQAAITAHGVKKVFYANDRKQAAAIQFSDEEQYHHIAEIDKYLTHASDLNDQEQQFLRSKLDGHGAVVLDKDNNVIAYGDADMNTHDALATLPSMNAIRNACEETNSFHLPEGCALITQNKIHPTSFTTADWARIGRDDDIANPIANDAGKDPKKIVYFNDDFEQVTIKNADGKTRNIDAASILKDVNKLPDQRTLLPTERLTNQRTLNTAHDVFKKWQAMIDKDPGRRY